MWTDITALSLEFNEISQSMLCEIVTKLLNYRKMCSHWMPNVLTAGHKNTCLASALTFWPITGKKERSQLWQEITLGISLHYEWKQKLFYRNPMQLTTTKIIQRTSQKDHCVSFSRTDMVFSWKNSYRDTEQ